MKQIVTEAIILRRSDYGEADRIITLLTPAHGKLTGITKGARKSKSKLAGGIELFSVAEISLLEGRSEIKTITSTRLSQYFDKIISTYERSSAGFEILKVIHKAIDEKSDKTYYELLKDSLIALNDTTISPELVELWFYSHLLRLEGRQPNLKVALEAEKGQAFNFDFSSMSFAASEQGTFSINNLKLLRLLATHKTSVLRRLQDAEQYCGACLGLMRRINQYIT